MKVETGPAAGNYFYTRDHLNSVRELVDNSGNVRARYSYDPYGRRTKVSGDVDADFGFAGMFWSAESGLNHTLFRAYDPQLTRWLSRDPLKNAESQEGPNLYTYAKLNPINGADRLGLCCESEKKLMDDLEEAITEICKEIALSTDRTCAMMKVHPDDPWKYTCREAQLNVNNLCVAQEQRFSSAMAIAAGNYFTCLAKGCRQAAPCPKPAPAPEPQDDYDCNKDGNCMFSTGRPAERNAAGTPSHNDFVPGI
jgi:RHS repeat-associated protein